MPTGGGAGLPITFTDTTKNQGAGAAVASTTAYYLSTNSVLDAGDVALGSRSVAALAPGPTDTGSVTVTIPAGTATGTYYVFAMADAAGVVGEVSEVNNTSARTLVVGPDLYISAFSVPAAEGAGATITVNDTTQPGRRDRGGVNTRFYLGEQRPRRGRCAAGRARGCVACAGNLERGIDDTRDPAGPGGPTTSSPRPTATMRSPRPESNNLSPPDHGRRRPVSPRFCARQGGAGLALTITDTEEPGRGRCRQRPTYYLRRIGARRIDVVLEPCRASARGRRLDPPR